MSRFLARLFGLAFLVSLGIAVVTWLRLDELPPPDSYREGTIPAPRQQPTTREPFEVEVGGERYRIEPLFDYALEGVVVSYHDADSFVDTWHQPEPMACRVLDDARGAFQVLGCYGPDSDWGWRIALFVRAPTGELVLQMTNIAPWGEETRAVRMACRRA